MTHTLSQLFVHSWVIRFHFQIPFITIIYPRTCTLISNNNDYAHTLISAPWTMLHILLFMNTCSVSVPWTCPVPALPTCIHWLNNAPRLHNWESQQRLHDSMNVSYWANYPPQERRPSIDLTKEVPNQGTVHLVEYSLQHTQ